MPLIYENILVEMRNNFINFKITAICVFLFFSISCKLNEKNTDDIYLSYTIDTKKQELKFYYKNENKESFKSIINLKKWLDRRNKKLIFAMNGGMYKQDGTPLGLFIENRQQVSPLDTKIGKGNFYIRPNGVFYITTKNHPKITSTEKFRQNKNIKFATQSGPMLLINRRINPVFNQKSNSLKIRNGVGILPNNKVIFVMSKKVVNFYDFANYFKNKGCKNALYLDGTISRTYLPEKNWVQTDGNFGVIIGVSEDKK